MAKKRQIEINETGISIYQWLGANQEIFMTSMYENIFDFMASKKKSMIVLDLRFKTNEIYITNEGEYIDHTKVLIKLIKDENLLSIVDNMIKYYERIEAYENCQKLVDLKKEYNIC